MRIEQQQLELNVKMTRLGGKIIELKKVYKAYGNLNILKGFRLYLQKRRAHRRSRQERRR